MNSRPPTDALQGLLVGTDFSPRADAALRRAAAIAAERGAALTVFHAANASSNGQTAARSGADTQALLDAKIGKLRLPSAVAARSRVGKGEPVSEIIRQAREEAAGLIVLGAHGTSFIKDLFVGTTAEKVLRNGNRPVLIVKRNYRRSYRKLLVPVDFSDYSLRALELALQLAPQAECHVLHAYRGFEGQLSRAGMARSKIVRYRRQLAKRARKEMSLFLSRLAAHRPVKSLLRHGRAAVVIAKTVQRLRPDLVAVGASGRAGLPYYLLGSVAEHVLREAPCDVLVTR